MFLRPVAAILLIVSAMLVVATPGQLRAQDESAEVRLLGWECLTFSDTTPSNAGVPGQVRNVSARTLHDVRVVVDYMATDGSWLKTDSAFVPESVNASGWAPEQVITFEVRTGVDTFRRLPTPLPQDDHRTDSEKQWDAFSGGRATLGSCFVHFSEFDGRSLIMDAPS